MPTASGHGRTDPPRGSQPSCPRADKRQYFVTGQAWSDADGDEIADLYVTNQVPTSRPRRPVEGSSRICRVYDLGPTPKVYEVRPPYRAELTLKPVTYRARR